MEVYKFGGASVKNIEAVKNVVQILLKETEPKLLVFSAMGKTTNALEAILDAFVANKEDKIELLKNLMIDHISIMDGLFSRSSEAYRLTSTMLQNKFEELYRILFSVSSMPYNQAYDAVVSFGERLSTLLISSYLKTQGIKATEVDAGDLIITDSTYREGRVLWDKTKENIDSILPQFIEQDRIIVTQGFIAKDQDGNYTTLGREGSDYSAAIFAHCIDAEQMTIWKDVPGVLNADPKYFAQTIKLKHISYNDAVELAYFGASVIHPKTIKPLQNKNIPLYVRSFLDINEEGTWVGKEDAEREENIPSYIFKPNQVLLSLYPKDFSFIDENSISKIFEILSKEGVKVNLMQNSALSFSLCVDISRANFDVVKMLLHEHFNYRYNEDVDLITIRHFSQEVIDSVVDGREVLLEQKTRHTAQIVVKND